ncbi:MAG: hypothetical protein OXB93_04040 [Cytophagales bacterium]|nr:hypothetical protein [Cytophagales bacterium]
MRKKNKIWKGAMLGIFLILGLGCDLFQESSVSPEEVFVKFYGEEGKEQAVDFAKVEGGYLLLGYTNSSGILNKGEEDPQDIADGEADIYLILTDEAGNEQNSFTYTHEAPDIINTGGEKEAVHSRDIPAALMPTSDGNFIILATSTYRVNHGVGTTALQSDILLIRVDYTGKELSRQIYGKKTENIRGTETLANEIAVDIVELEDGLVIVGTTNIVDTLKSTYASSRAEIDLLDVFLFKISKDAQERIIWERKHGYGGEDQAVSAIADENEVVVLARTDAESETNGGGKNILFFKVDRFGSVIAARTLGQDGDEEPAHISRLANNDYTLTGSYIASGTELSFLYRIFGDSPTNEIYGLGRGSNRTLSLTVAETNPPGYWLVGQLKDFKRGTVSKGSEILLIRLGQTGTVLEEYGDAEVGGVHYGGIEDDEAVKAIELSNGEVVVFGTLGFEGGSSMMCLLKCNKRGELKQNVLP